MEESLKTGKSNLQRQRSYLSRGGLNPTLVAYYYQHFGHVHRILDLGCGLGYMGKFKPDSAIEVYGLDIDEVAVTEARKYENVQVWNLETEQLPFDSEYFDAILVKDVMEHLHTPWTLVMEIYRTLRPGGIVISSVPMAKAQIVWDDYTHIRGFTSYALRSLFEDSGFDVLHIHKMGGIPLAGKLHLLKYIPTLLRFPPLDLLWGRSLEIKARRPADDSKE